MDIESAIKQYLNLKNRLIPSTETEIYTLKRGIPKKVKSLKKIKNASTNIEDFEWAIRTRGFTIFNLFSLTSYIVFFIFSIIESLINILRRGFFSSILFCSFSPIILSSSSSIISSLNSLF